MGFGGKEKLYGPLEMSLPSVILRIEPTNSNALELFVVSWSWISVNGP